MYRELITNTSVYVSGQATPCRNGSNAWDMRVFCGAARTTYCNLAAAVIVISRIELHIGKRVDSADNDK